MRTYALNGNRVKVGDIVTVRLSGLAVAVKLLELRWSYGHLDALIEPVNGSGTQRIRLDERLVT